MAISDRFAIVPAERLGHQGLYLYTDRSAFFLPLGAPGAEKGEAQEFFLRARISNVGDVLLTFRNKKPGSESNILPGISYETTTPSAIVSGKYRVTPANDVPDDVATEVLRRRLGERIATIKAFIDEKNRYSTPADAKRAFERDRVTYLAKLERCRIKGDRKLNSVVADEVQKLESGLPGGTIWDKEIVGSLSPSVTR